MARSPKRSVPPERRNNRGGVRQGTPGVSYANRTDLNAAPAAPTTPTQPVRTAPGQEYGAATTQAASQRAMPLPNNIAMPASLTHPHAPSDRPDEHVMAGVPSGPGPGPGALTLPPGGPNPDQDLEATIRGLYLAHPNRDLARALAQIVARKQANQSSAPVTV